MNDKTWLGTIAQIKQWRIKHNVSQRALAEVAGVSRNTYASWERRNTVLGGADIIKLNRTIFAWGENDYITNIQTPAEPEYKTKKKKSLLWYIGYYIGKSIRFVLRTLCIIK